MVADVFSKSKRSEVMSRIRSRGNRGTELRLIAIFRLYGITGWRGGTGCRFGLPVCQRHERFARMRCSTQEPLPAAAASPVATDGEAPRSRKGIGFFGGTGGRFYRQCPQAWPERGTVIHHLWATQHWHPAYESPSDKWAAPV